MTGNPHNWKLNDFNGFDPVGDNAGNMGDFTSCFIHQEGKHITVRLNFDDMTSYSIYGPVRDLYSSSDIEFSVTVKNMSNSALEYLTRIPLNVDRYEDKNLRSQRNSHYEMLEFQFVLPENIDKRNLRFEFTSFNKGQISDSFITTGEPSRNTGNTAFVHHGNQGLTYTEVFYGSDPVDQSGYDEVLQVHESTGLPGNFHMSGTLMPAAQWHNPEFNSWLTTLAANGEACMMTSALGQHIMPFVQNNMNDWSVQIESDMVNYRYNYVPHIAWVPERVWLAPGNYPDAGVLDWLGDNWTQHGVQAVILDDSPHLNGYDNRKIHWMNNASGVTLRVIPINNTFVGQVMYDAQGAKNTIQNTTQYGIAVYGTDWEVIAEMNEHHNTNFLENYTDILNYCANNFPAIGVWKLDDAINNADFNGTGAEITPGTYGMLGGHDGYGGSNNSWYTDWAGTASHSDFHNPTWNYGYIWNETYQHLMSVPNNNLSQLGWYTLMINLHETGWHDTGVSGWEHRYSSHIKNANVYAEGARWADGQYAQGAHAFSNDIDHDGITETILFNNKIMAVFENNGGRAAWIFTKDTNGIAHSVVGSDMAYWSETNGDYNESSNNHFASLSEVSPNYQNDAYNITINQSEGNVVSVTMTKNEVSKVITLQNDSDFLNVQYSFSGWGYVKSGWTPDLLDILWSGKGHLQRMWGDNGSYCGQRDSASGATVAMVLGNGGGQHNGEFEGTLVKGDEIKGLGTFNVRLFAGYTSIPYDTNFNKVVELDQLALDLNDTVPPQIVNNRAAIVGQRKLEIVFSEPVNSFTATALENYTLSGITNNSITNIILTHSRKVILTLANPLPTQASGTVTVQNVTDITGNAITAPNNVATITTVIIPHIVGTFNNWVPSNHDHDLVLQDNGLWSVTISMPADANAFKILESDSWNNNDWPANNMTVTLTIAQDITIYANCGVSTGEKNGDEFVFNTPNYPIVTGSFLSELGDTDWSTTTNVSVMNDDGNNNDTIANDGIYTWEHLLPAGNYEYKVVLNRNWDQNTTSANLPLDLTGNTVVKFTYDMRQNLIQQSFTTSNNDPFSVAISPAILRTNYPNPFNPATTMSFELKTAAYARLKIFNSKGQLVNTLCSDQLSKGIHSYIWNDTDSNHTPVSSGLYLYALEVNGKIIATKKCVLMK